MVERTFWLDRVERGWRTRPIAWLPGVRRSGKTMLSRSLPKSVYFDCDLPSIREDLADPEAFLDHYKGKRIILDEVHRLDNPSQLLKIAADHYPGTRILATGSSSLEATARFRDTLTGRKFVTWLTPMCSADLDAFGDGSLDRRLMRGGLPPFFLADDTPATAFDEWMQSYWARDIQELFKVGKRSSFLKFADLLIARSGGMFEATAFAGPCEVSRPTISEYLAIMEETFVVHVIKPYSTRPSTEIVSAPRVYAFDTGFVCHHRRLTALRPEDFGLLWEHLVLNELQALTGIRRIQYWRTKGGREVDFILSAPGWPFLAIECKRSTAQLDPVNVLEFCRHYPQARAVIVTSDARQELTRKFDNIPVTVTNLSGLGKLLQSVRHH